MDPNGDVPLRGELLYIYIFCLFEFVGLLISLIVLKFAYLVQCHHIISYQRFVSLLLQYSEKVKIIHLNGESDASKKVKIISHFCVCAKSPKVYSFNDYYWSIYVSFSDLVVLNDGSIGLFGSFIQSSSRHGSPKGINTKPNFHLLFSKNAGWFYLFIFLCCVNQFVTISWLIYKINFMLKPKL